jgi:LmbE family N-acetylglucosaminyl deacetylase
VAGDDDTMSKNGTSAASRFTESHDTSLFILAHPDDELAFAPLLDMLVAAGRPIRLVYLTDGVSRGVTTETRIAETTAALDYLGIAKSQAHFIGSDSAIPDGLLYRHMARAADAVEALSPSWGDIGAVYAFSWEGGHADHDAALLIAAAFAVRRALTVNFWQLPFYRASDMLPAPVFTLSAPLAANGSVVRLPLNARQKQLPRKLIRFYPSQRRTFLGLGPFIFWHSVSRSSLGLQQMELNRLWQRPTARPLLFESRNGISFDDFSKAATTFLESRGLSRPMQATAS